VRNSYIVSYTLTFRRLILDRRIEDILSKLDPELRRVIERIQPRQAHPRLPADWLHWQIIERYTILREAGVNKGSNVLEIGCGPHAIATIALALLVGKEGRVVALDRGRWGEFWQIVKEGGLESVVIPVEDNARNLSFPYSCFDLVVCVHGIRSFADRFVVVAAVNEMLRVTKERVFLAESSPMARNAAQRAHLTMYNLRRPTFLARGQAKAGDVHYFSPEEMKEIVEEAGAARVEVKLIDVDIPHHLAYFPLEYIEKINDETVREDLKKKWRKALDMLEKCGEEHPPVVAVNAWKSKT
jgi:ubiquinone/menaquinone biosynthesis C-methylase UbiE